MTDRAPATPDLRDATGGRRVRATGGRTQAMPHGPRPPEPRIAPLPADEQDEETRSLLARIDLPAPTVNIFTTVARHRGLFRRWLSISARLMAGTLPSRTRELAILRTAWRCGSEYEWGQHLLLGLHAGLRDEEIERVKEGPGAPGWEPTDAAVLRATDELHDDSCISDATWERLAAVLDEEQLIELVMLVGHYHQVAFVLNSLGVEREEGVPGFGG